VAAVFGRGRVAALGEICTGRGGAASNDGLESIQHRLILVESRYGRDAPACLCRLYWRTDDKQRHVIGARKRAVDTLCGDGDVIPPPRLEAAHVARVHTEFAVMLHYHAHMRIGLRRLRCHCCGSGTGCVQAVRVSLLEAEEGDAFDQLVSLH